MRNKGTFPLTAISYDKNTVVCVSKPEGDRKHGILSFSYDGSAFETCFDDERFNVIDVCYAQAIGLFIGITDRGEVLRSDDGKIWTVKLGRFINTNLISLTWEEKREQWEAVFMNDGVESYYYSSDSINWKLERSESVKE